MPSLPVVRPHADPKSHSPPRTTEGQGERQVRRILGTRSAAEANRSRLPALGMSKSHQQPENL